MQSYFDCLYFDLQERILKLVRSEDIYNTWKSGCISKDTFQTIFFHVHQRFLKETNDSSYSPNLDYFYIHITSYYIKKEYVKRISSFKQKANTNEDNIKDKYKLLLQKTLNDDKEITVASQLHILSVIDKINALCIILPIFYDAIAMLPDNLPVMNVDPRVVASVCRLKMLSIPFKQYMYAKETNVVILAQWDHYNYNGIVADVYGVFRKMLDQYPFDTNIVKSMIRLQAPFSSILYMLLKLDNFHLIQFFLEEWKQTNGEFLMFDPDPFSKCFRLHYNICISTLSLLLDSFILPPDINVTNLSKSTLKSKVLFERLLELPWYSEWETVMNLTRAGVFNSSTIPESLFNKIYSFTKSQAIPTDDIIFIFGLADDYWKMYDVVSIICLDLVFKLDEDQIEDIDILDSYPMELLEVLIQKTPIDILALSFNDPDSNIDFTTESVKIGLLKVLELKPEIVSHINLTVKLLRDPVWIDIILRNDVLRKRYGEEFVKLNYSNIEIIKIVLEHRDIHLNLFRYLFNKALVSGNKEMLNILDGYPRSLLF